MNATADKKRNLQKAEGFARQAASRKAEFILLPEIFHYRGSAPKTTIAETIPGESLLPLMKLAKEKKVFILAGSIYEKNPGASKVFNTTTLINPVGEIIARYRKINLFQAVIGRQTINESQTLLAGKKLALATVGEFKTALSICYDLRFPELYRAYFKRHADIIAIPSCFTRTTGQAHWEVLVRARAIENRCYVLAPNQCGSDERGVQAFGHSLIVGPWGEILAKASGNKEEIIYGHLNQSRIKRTQAILPSIRYFGKMR